MTDNDIIKASECCVKARKRGDCIDLKCPACVKEGCAYYNRTDEDYEGVIFAEIGKDLLDIIKRQRAEIERKDRILESYALQYGTVADKDVLLKRAKAEAVKEFAERLKKEAGYFGRAVAVKDIDDLVKEMVGE